MCVCRRADLWADAKSCSRGRTGADEVGALGAVGVAEGRLSVPILKRTPKHLLLYNFRIGH